MKIFNKIFVFFFITSSIHLSAQFALNNVDFDIINLKNIKRIVQTENGKTRRITEYNTNGKIIFQYKFTEFSFMKYGGIIEIRGFEYCNEGNLKKEYYLHSNAGHYIKKYSNNIETDVDTVLISYTPKLSKKKINKNPLIKISKIKTFKDILKNKDIKRIDKESNYQFSKLEFPKDEKNTKLIIGYNRKKDTASVKKQIFNSKNILIKEIIERKRNGKSSYQTNTYSQTDNLSKTKISHLDKKMKEKFNYQFAERLNNEKLISFKYSRTKDKIVNTTRIVYSKENRIIEKITYSSNFEKDFTKPNELTNKIGEIEFEYNKEGLLKKEVLKNYKNNTKTTKKYTYKYKYQ